VSIDDIPVDITNTQSGDVDPSDVPDEIESITRGLAGEQPPTSPTNGGGYLLHKITSDIPTAVNASEWFSIEGNPGVPCFETREKVLSITGTATD